MIKDKKWKLLANQLTEMMNDDHDNPWYKKIAGGNEKISGPSVSYSGFSKSLKELLETPVFAQGDTESNLKAFKAYWNGIEEVNPDSVSRPTIFNSISNRRHCFS